MLDVDDLHAYYGKSHILQGVSFRVGEGEIVSLLGRNGAGRSTTIKTIMGEVAPVGTIRFRGERIDGLAPHVIARKGLGYLIMVDEPTEGLAPLIVERVRELLETVSRRGVAILLIEQKLAIALTISQRLYVMGQGRIVFEGTPQDLRKHDAVRKEWLEV